LGVSKEPYSPSTLIRFGFVRLGFDGWRLLAVLLADIGRNLDSRFEEFFFTVLEETRGLAEWAVGEPIFVWACSPVKGEPFSTSIVGICPNGRN
jgi:hypothetical protein